ncbi:hypothetical protein Q1695_009576 [Nippostrongylus brasiliensis]|nr:hypothetical protein Q1695_009576 [Nippostrongylus brasiliensis]
MICTLDEFIAIETGECSVVGWQGVSSATFSASVSVIPVAANELRDPAIWLFVLSFLGTRVWQGLSKYIIIGTLNFALIDASEAERLGYTAESQFNTILAPYADSVCVPGPTKMMFVVIDGSSRSIADTVIVRPAGNSVTPPVRKAGVQTKARKIHTNLLTALTGASWEKWPDPSALVDPN